MLVYFSAKAKKPQVPESILKKRKAALETRARRAKLIVSRKKVTIILYH